MTLRLLAAREDANAVWELDDIGSPTDAGTAFTPTLVTHPQDFGKAGGEGQFRRADVWVLLGDDTTIEVTPVVDGVIRTDQAWTASLTVSNGTAQRIEAPFAVMGRRFSIRVRCLSGLMVSLGSVDWHLVPKRSQTGGG